MQIIEQKLAAKSGRIEDSEDMIFASDWFASVIDGVTLKECDLKISQRPGQIATELICSAINRFPRNINGPNAISSLIKSISEYCESKFDSNQIADFKRHIAASVAIYSRYKREIWIVGDCQALVGNQLFCNKSLIDTTMANARSLFLQRELKLGKSLEELLENDTGRKFIKPLLDKQRLFLNNSNQSDFNYHAICGVPLPARYTFEPILIPADVDEIVLATDGYPYIENTLDNSEKILKKILDSDPLCMDLNKSTKGLERGNESFDDRAYLRIRVNNYII